MKIVLMCAVGLAAAIAASMGLGGGFIMLLYYVLFTDLKQVKAQGANLLFFLPVTAVSIILHIKNGLIDKKSALICGLVGALTAVGGCLVAEAVEGALLRKIFAVFIIIAGLKDLFAKKQNQQNVQ